MKIAAVGCDAFGQGQTLSGAVGTLSLTDRERESGYSISSLFVKYRTQLVGYYWAEVFGKEFPLQFSFNQVADAESELTLRPGELVLVPAACKEVTLQGHCLVKSVKCVN